MSSISVSEYPGVRRCSVGALGCPIDVSGWHDHIQYRRMFCTRKYGVCVIWIMYIVSPSVRPAPPIFPILVSLLLPAPLNTTIDQNPSRPARAVGTASGARLVGHAEPGVIGGYAVPGGQRRAGGCDEGGDYQTGQRREESSSHGRAVNGVDERDGCSTLCGTGLRLQWRRSSDRREVRLIIP